MSDIPFATAYGPHLRVVAPHSDDTKTVQEAAAECDINVIVRRAAQTGVANVHPVEYGEMDESTYQECLAKINDAKERFESLPSDIRLRFGNDPARLLAAIDDPSQTDELIKLGLLTRSETPVEPVSAPAPTPATPDTP